MTKIKLPLHTPNNNSLDLVQTELSPDNRAVSLKDLPFSSKNKSGISLPIVDISRITSPIRDIVLRTGEEFVLSLSDSANSFSPLVLATSQSNYYNHSQMIEVKPINSSKVFADIFPNRNVYQGSVSRAWQNMEEFYSFLLENKFFLGFLISLNNSLLTNLAYQSSLLIMSVFSTAQEIPSSVNNILGRYNRLVNILVDRQLRGMWWLNISTDIKILLKKLVKLAKLVWNIVSKFYLVSMLVVCVGFLQNAAPKISGSQNGSSEEQSSVARKSIFEDYLARNSVSVAAMGEVYNNSDGSNDFSKNLATRDEIDESELSNRCFAYYTYKVKPGQTPEQIAALYNLDAKSILINNNLSKEDSLQANQEIKIPCRDAIIYTIKENDTIDSLSQRYNLEPITLQSINADNIEANGFNVGNEILIPNISFEDFNAINKKLGNKETSANQTKLSVNKQQTETVKKPEKAKQQPVTPNNADAGSDCGMVWPTSTKNVTQYPSLGHMAVDIANRSMPDIFAAKSGKVIFAGWDSTGYGNMVKIDHGICNGKRLITVYAHNSKLYVNQGDYVTAGQSISKMGATGHVVGATGIHLHFEVRILVDGKEKRVDPLSYI